MKLRKEQKRARIKLQNEPKNLNIRKSDSAAVKRWPRDKLMCSFL